MKNKILLIVSIIALSSNSYANPWYIDGSFGASNPKSINHIDFPGKFSNSNLFSIAAGYKQDEHLRYDLLLMFNNNYNYYDTDNDSDMPAEGRLVQTRISNYEHKAKLSNMSLFFNVYYHFTKLDNGLLNPYIGGGFGFVNNKLGDIYHYIDVPGKELAKTILGDSQSDFAWNLVIGNQTKLNDHMKLFLEYRYIDFGKFQTSLKEYHHWFKGTPDYEFVSDNVDRGTSKLTSNSFFAGIRFDL